MTLSERAYAFVERWEERPPDARDRSSLAFLLTVLLSEVAKEATRNEHQRIAAKLSALVD